MIIEPIADYRSPLKSKFGVPRQSGLAPGLGGSILFRPEYRDAAAVRGLDGFGYIWLIWGFSANKGSLWRPTVRPPRLGGNERMGVFATRSPFRPNGLGLSAVRLVAVTMSEEGPVLEVRGADLMDGTPIYDIKPYVVYADSYPDATCGFVDAVSWQDMQVVFPEVFPIAGEELEALREVLSQDPRPGYHDDPGRVYGMPFGCWDIRFSVSGRALTVLEAVRL